MINDNFSLMRGGPTYRFVRALGRLTPSIHLDRLMLGLLVLLSFLPMALLAWRDGTLLGGGVELPLLDDYYTLARFLVAMPLLVLAARFSDRTLRGTMWQLFRGGLVAPGHHARFARVLARAHRLRDGWLPECLCLVPAFLPSFALLLQPGLIPVQLPELTTWRFDAAGRPTSAGAWLHFAAAPLFRFLVLLWLWRLLLWSWLLWRFSRMHLDLRPAHPDLCGGLRFLGLAQCRFAVLSAAGAILLCGYGANQMLHAGQSLHGLRYLIFGYAIVSTLLLAPLALMSIAMARAKRHGLARYDALGHGLAKAFDTKWKRNAAPAASSAMLDSPHPSALADFSGVYGNIVGMSLVPVTRWHMLRMVLAALVPFVPLAFIAMPVDELAPQLVQILM